ncbi:MAG TPA: PEP-CTERM sorting domain-containing protein, partial [Saprospiraceae bacterium]|nr:PEP-CTERM sorting domain-containing protein [Saprospiraceae bacterium]
ADFDPETEVSTFINYSDSLSAIPTFSYSLDPYAYGGAFNPVYVGPGDQIQFQANGLHSDPTPVMARPVRNGIAPPTKSWDLKALVTEGHESDHGDWWVYHNGNWNKNYEGKVKYCDWILYGPYIRIEITDGNKKWDHIYGIGGGGHSSYPNHLNDPHHRSPPDYPSDWPFPHGDPLPAPLVTYMDYDAAMAFLGSGYIEIPATDSDDFFSVITPYAGAGCTVPEPSSLTLWALGMGVCFWWKQCGKVRSGQKRQVYM